MLKKAVVLDIQHNDGQRRRKSKGGHLVKYWGQSCCFNKMTSHLPIFLKQRPLSSIDLRLQSLLRS